MLLLLVAGFFVGRLTTDDTTGAQDANGPTEDELQQAGLPTDPPVQGESDEPVAAVAEAVAPAVVQIETDLGLGSGVAYDPKGLIITNNHVVEGSTQVNVRFADGSTTQGEVVGTDPSSDIAVVQVAKDSLLGVAVLALDEDVRVGQTAVAIGSPFALDQTVTSGIVSAVDRPFPTGSGTEPGIVVGMIQTDAPINHGNSGGALADRHGRVIGINTAILSSTDDNAGLGFAIPIKLAYERAQLLANGETIENAFLGIGCPEPCAEDDREVGAYIAEVTSASGADQAGLQPGDEVTALNGDTVRDFSELATKIVEHAPGEVVELSVHRDGETLTLDATLGSRP